MTPGPPAPVLPILASLATTLSADAVVPLLTKVTCGLSFSGSDLPQCSTKRMWEKRSECQQRASTKQAAREHLRNKMLLGWGSSIGVGLAAGVHLTADYALGTRSFAEFSNVYLAVFLVCFGFATYVDNSEALKPRSAPAGLAKEVKLWRDGNVQHALWALSVAAAVGYPMLPDEYRVTRGEKLSRAVVWIAPVLILKLAVGMSAILHRFCSHRAYEPRNRAVQFVLVALGCLSGQYSPLWWGAMHNRHHKHCDSPEDPHSPQMFPMWYAAFGWTVHESGRADLKRFLPGAWTELPEIQFLHRFFFVPVMAEYLAAWYLFGFAHFVYGAWLPSTLCAVFTLLFNVRSHHPALEDMSDSRCQAFNVVDIGAWAVGESAHLDHHHDPKSFNRASDAFFGSYDFPYYLFIRPLACMGLITLDREHTPEGAHESAKMVLTLLGVGALIFICSSVV